MDLEKLEKVGLKVMGVGVFWFASVMTLALIVAAFAGPGPRGISCMSTFMPVALLGLVPIVVGAGIIAYAGKAR